jgi:hypothetical protein
VAGEPSSSGDCGLAEAGITERMAYLGAGKVPAPNRLAVRQADQERRDNEVWLQLAGRTRKACVDIRQHNRVADLDSGIRGYLGRGLDSGRNVLWHLRGNPRHHTKGPKVSDHIQHQAQGLPFPGRDPEPECDHINHPIWTPMPRCTGCGHRTSLVPGWRPIETRRLGFFYWLAELPMRLLARSMKRHSDNRRWAGEERG